MLENLRIKVVDRSKSYRSSEAVVASVQQGEVIPRGDVGAYLVGVFACQPLTADGKRYDLGAKGQWGHCRFKKEWKAALQGRDEFTEDQKRLILAGASLLSKYFNGWGRKAIEQDHVNKLLKRWA